MFRVDLAADDVAAVRTFVRELAGRYGSVEDPEFLAQATTFAHELPRTLRTGLNRFRLEEPDGVCVVGGYQVDQSRIGPTPAHWKDCKDNPATLEEEIFFFLCGCLLGDPIGWATQQNGYLMHDIFPIKGHENEQLGSGSEQLLTWHTEDAFHPLRTDYVGLMCLRNPDGVETTYAVIDDVKLDDETSRLLREPRYPIRPDHSHLPRNKSADARTIPGTEELLQRSYEWITRLDEQPERIEVLFGHPDSPYVRLDPYFMDTSVLDEDASAALQTIIDEIDVVMTGCSLRPGDVLFIDNYKTVHGRKPFKARFDGTDRWLKRINVARDPRKSRAARAAASARVIF
ncbi:guanitoxin biosynthesis L-enduracididine beta-hydroxylase GntD [Lentzea sp. NPDC034063]|uniref:guanitoxin biosynthesis L-enduracididine beta-hydroxylase GntD n=1 Tax=unclassified Lentzea TaxID=2643253 RepID=UPI003407D09E